jgi:hypothetical protein
MKVTVMIASKINVDCFGSSNAQNHGTKIKYSCTAFLGILSTFLIGVPSASAQNTDGMILSDTNPGLALNAYGGARHLGPLRLVAGCPEKNTDCTWTFRDGMIISDSDPTLAIHARGGAQHLGELWLHNNCKPDNPDCTWTFRDGMIISNRNPNLAINAYGGARHLTEPKLVANCPPKNPDCTWTYKVGGGDSNSSDPRVIRAYLDGLPKLALVPSSPGTIGKIPNLAEGLSGEQRTGGRFVNDAAELALLKPLSDIIWPGALVQGATISNNSFSPIIVPRAAGRVRLATEFVGKPAQSTFRDLPVVGAGEISNARTSMLNEINATGSSGTTFLELASAGTVREGMVKLGFAYKGPSASVSVDAKLNSSYEENTIFAKFVQTFYTVAFDPDPNVVSPFFNPSVTLEDVQRYTNRSNPPLYVSEVSYGRVLLVQFTAKMSKLEMEAAIKAAYGSVSGSLDASYKESLNRMSVKVLSIGSTGDVAVAPLTAYSPGDTLTALKSYINSGINYSPSNPGAPIAFTMRYVGSTAPDGVPNALAVAQMVTDESPEVVNLTAKEVCHSPSLKIWIGSRLFDTGLPGGGYQVWDGPGGGWVDTGLTANPGDKVRFSASGENWSGVFATGRYGPGGWTHWDKPGWDQANYPIGNRSPFALIARFGGANNTGKDVTGGAENGISGSGSGNSSSFFVGTGMEIVAGGKTYTNHGRIYLGTNDNDPLNGDASFKFNVNVCITRKLY